jgi:hypothetical protein
LVERTRRKAISISRAIDGTLTAVSYEHFPMPAVTIADLDEQASERAAASLANGPDGHLNWRLSADGAAENAMEVAIYSDAQLVEHTTQFGPYELINTIPTDRREQLPMAAVLRMTWHIQRDALPDMSASNHKMFYGGVIWDEITALISLALGIRAQAGGIIREFRNDDPRGLPVQHSHRRPTLPPVQALRRTIPSLGQANITDIPKVLDIYPRIPPDKAIDVVRAARMYQLGAWMSDADPEYAWLKFVSALEAAAVCWWRGGDDPTDALRKVKPDLAATLQDAGGEDLVAQVGDSLKDQLRATHRFLTFMKRYAPPPPDPRPPAVVQVDWEQLHKAIALVYRYRSDALHSGLSFPPPLLEPPLQLARDQPLSERPVGSAVAYGHAVWEANELPMHLHVFEYITRSALLSWLHDGEQGPTA